MKHTYTWDKYNNLYYANQMDGKWCLVVCMAIGVEEANKFCSDNEDCSVIADIGGVILIAFTDDLGVKEIK